MMNPNPLSIKAGKRMTSLLTKPPHTLLTIVWLFFALFSSYAGQAQDFHKNKAKYYKNIYKKGNSSLARACDIVKKSKKTTKNRAVHAHGGSKKKAKPMSMAEVDTSAPVASTKKAPIAAQPPPKIASPTKPVFKPSPIASKEKLDQLHKKEDQVLALNHLPAPSSEKHEEIRRLVSNTITKKKDNEPIELEPLYFTFDQDEFSVVDMDPFLIAVEFALQGKHILIEGHTDHQGADDYNVQLSIKRVQKIRQLMLDMGVSDDQISIVGYGEEVTDHSNKSEDGKQQNRRVDFKAF